MWSAMSAGLLLALGMADATAIRVAAARGNGVGALASGTLGLAITLAIVAMLAVAVAIAPGGVAGFYTSGPPLAEALTALLPLGAAVLVCDSAVLVAAATLRGLSDVTWPTVIQIATALCLLPLAWWLAIVLGGGAVGLVQAILLTSLLRAALLAARFVRRAGGASMPLSPQTT